MELLPAWLRRKAGDWEAWRYPEGQDGITEAFRLYFAMLDAAVDSGWPFEPASTPLERIESLQLALPGVPVREVTECFNQACYGEMPNAAERLQRLKALLEEQDIAL